MIISLKENYEISVNKINKLVDGFIRDQSYDIIKNIIDYIRKQIDARKNLVSDYYKDLLLVEDDREKSIKD